MSEYTNPLDNPGASHRSSHANEKLTELGFEVEETRSFIESNLADISFMYNIFLTYGIDTDMIAEIMDIDGVDGESIANYFASLGIDSTDLGGTAPTIAVETDHDDETDSEDENDSDIRDAVDEIDSEDDDDYVDPDYVDVVVDGTYSGSITSTSDLLSFEGTVEATVTDDQVSATWSIDDLGLFGTLSGIVDNATGEYTLSDVDSEISYGLTITGTITDDSSTGTWSAGFFSGAVETAIFIA